LLPLDKIRRLTGFGQSSAAESYVFSPGSLDEVAEAFQLAERSGFQIVLRGAGRSYGDAAIGEECLALEFSKFGRILEWDPSTGHVEAEPGTTIEDLWRRCLPDGWWPPVVSGTMFPTLGGALAMNIHGKNAFKAGTLGEHVREMDVFFPNGEMRTLGPEDERFYDVISSAGLLGVIVRVRLQMKRVESGMLEVFASSRKGWTEQFEAFEERGESSDYTVSWIDAFGSGRGLFHSANHVHEAQPETLRPEAQDLPAKTLGMVPKAQVWRILKLFNRRGPMRVLNLAKHVAGRATGNGRSHRQSLVAFSFLLDYVPNWQSAYLPGGFIQYQSFIPEASARQVFEEQIAMQRAERLENFLTVMKRHRPDRFLFSHGVQGYSLAMDFKVTPETWSRMQKMCWRMNDLAIQAGGRFYLAKDSTLRPADLEAYLGAETLDRFRRLKSEMDPKGLLTSALGRRLGLS
jgi:decaprenylphospho-beta-D-ribofuranose 2-oxidase